jgi:serine/threonine protein kinase
MHQRTGIVNQGPVYDEINDLPTSSCTSAMPFQQLSRADNAFWEFPPDKIKILRKLGEGSFGSVNKAKILPLHSMTLINGGIVAVKTLKGVVIVYKINRLVISVWLKLKVTFIQLQRRTSMFENSASESTTAKDRKDFLNELNLMKKLEPHSHVVQLLGCCTLSGRS